MEKKSNSKSKTPYFIALVLLLLASNFYFFYKKQLVEKDHVESTAILEDQKRQLQKEYDEIIDELEIFRAENFDLDSTLTVMKGDIEEKKLEIEKLLASNQSTIGELKKARQLVNSMKTDLDSYRSQLADLQQQNQVLATEISQLDKQNDDLVSQKQTLIGQSNELARKNLVTEREKAKVVEEKRVLEAGQQQLKTYSEEVQAQNLQLRDQIEEVVEVKNVAIKQLQEEKKEVVEQKEEVIEKKEEEIKVLAEEKKEVIKEKREVIKEKEVVEEQNAEMKRKLEIAGAMKTDNISASAVRYKRNGKELESKAAKKTDKIKVCFDVKKNALAPKGNKEILLRILNPGGNTIYNESLGSGIAKLADEDKEIKYTTKATIRYKGKEESYCMYWESPAYDAGKYRAELYSNGVITGSSQFDLK